MLCSKCNQSADSLTDAGLCENCHTQAEERRCEIIELAREQREIEGAVACLQFANDQAALEAAVKAAEAQPALLKFVEEVARLKHEGEPGEDGKPFEITSEDAIATLNQLILEARQLLGTADKCDKCKETVPYVIGCPRLDSVDRAHGQR